MLIEVGILCATYVGVRLFESFKKKPTIKQLPHEAGDSSPLEDSPQNYLQKKVELAKQRKHYVKLSVVTLALSAVRQFVFSPLLGLVNLGFYIYTSIPFFRKVEKTLFHEKKINSDVLFFTAETLALGINQYGAASLQLLLFHTENDFVESAKDDFEKVTFGLFSELPQTVWTLLNGSAVETPLKEVKPNDIIVLSAGDMIPVDGIIIKGQANLDQRMLTGRAKLVVKNVGDSVFANTAIRSGNIQVRVEHSGQNTAASQIRDILLGASQFKSEVQLKGDAWAEATALPMWVSSAVLVPTLGAQSAAVFLNSHIGGALPLLDPMSSLKYLALVTQHGILVKDSQSLENLPQIDSVLFASTGLLSDAQMEVIQIVGSAQYSEQAILGYAATAESRGEHPLATAIVQEAKACDVPLMEVSGEVEHQIGYEVSVKVNDQRVLVGNLPFMTQEGMVVAPKFRQALNASHKRGNRFILVALDKKVIGGLEFQLAVASEVKATLTELRALGVKQLALLSGDHPAPTQRLAEDLGMDACFYETVPEDKARIVEDLQHQGQSVCVVGDGIHDAMTMARADVSISLNGARTLTKDRADIVFLDGTVSSLSPLLEQSEQIQTNLNQMLPFLVLPSAINLLGAFVFPSSIFNSVLVNLIFTVVGLRNTRRKLDAPSRDVKRIEG